MRTHQQTLLAGLLSKFALGLLVASLAGPSMLSETPLQQRDPNRPPVPESLALPDHPSETGLVYRYQSVKPQDTTNRVAPGGLDHLRERLLADPSSHAIVYPPGRPPAFLEQAGSFWIQTNGWASFASNGVSYEVLIDQVSVDALAGHEQKSMLVFSPHEKFSRWRSSGTPYQTLEVLFDENSQVQGWSWMY
jgi:hypothetical protein